MSFVCPVSVQSRSLWIGEIENWMDENYISGNFSHYGHKVKTVKIIRDKNTKSVMGYGFVEFFTPEAAKEALNNLNGKPIPNSQKTFKLNAATYSAGKVASMGNFPKNEFSIYVGDLDNSVTEEKLKEFFEEKYKSVVSVKIVIDNITKLGKGYGFVKFSNQAESIKAINEMNGKFLCGRSIKVNHASFKKISEMNNYYNHEKSGETKLNEDTIKNLNDFYVKSSLGDCNGIFNLSNFYMNHGKYFAGNNGSFSNSYNFNK